MQPTQKSIRVTTPKVETQVVQQQVGLPANYPCASRFVYAHFPANWEYDDEFGFLPRLSLVIAKPGAWTTRSFVARTDTVLRKVSRVLVVIRNYQSQAIRHSLRNTPVVNDQRHLAVGRRIDGLL